MLYFQVMFLCIVIMVIGIFDVVGHNYRVKQQILTKVETLDDKSAKEWLVECLKSDILCESYLKRK
jgi:hypothetical protein